MSPFKSARWFSIAAIAGLYGCKMHPAKVSVTPLVGTHWSSATYQLHLTISPAAFTWQIGHRKYVESFRILAKQQLLLSQDTIELYIDKEHRLFIHPLSKKLLAAKDLRVIYAARFLQNK
jgi:hypothetical protein